MVAFSPWSLGVARARRDVRPAHAGHVDRVNGEGVGDLRDRELEVIELGADRVQQDQCRRAGTRLQVPQTRPVAELGVLDLPRRGPCPGVVAVRPGFRSHRLLLSLSTRTSRATLAAPSDVRNPGGLVAAATD